MAQNSIKLPPGFVLDSPGSAVPTPPPGFVLDEGPFADVRSGSSSTAPQRIAEASGAPRWAQEIRNLVSNAVTAVNPIPALRYVYQHGWGETLNQMGGAQRAELDKAKAAFDRGDYKTALAKTLNWAVPLIGPAVGHAQEQAAEGDWSGAVGTSLGIGLGLASPRQVHDAVVNVRPILRPKLNSVEAAAVQFADQQGIPLDTATRSGGAVARTTQKLLERQVGSSGRALASRQAQSAALTETAERLRSATEPRLGAQAFTPDTAGQSIRNTLTGRVKRFDAKADEAYAFLRYIEADPKNAVDVNAAGNAAKAVDALLDDAVKNRMKEIVQTHASGVTELTGKARRAWEDLANPSDSGEIVGRWGGGFKKSFPELADFDQGPKAIAQSIQFGKGPLYESIRDSVRQYILDTQGDEIRAAVDTVPLPAGQAIPLPVDMRPVKAALSPVFERMKQRMPLAQQQASTGLKAVQNILEGEDFVPASVADGNLSAVKAVAREAASPELRNMSQGLAAKAVRELDLQVRAAVAKAGPEALQALERGRSLTRAKYSAADLLDTLKTEPVGVYNQLTQRGDAALNLLREVQKQAPQEMPKLGRAYLEGLFETATKEGGFDRTPTLFNQWNALGKETKLALFKNPATIKDIDNFFLIAKRLSDNPNPSGTAASYAWFTTLGLTYTNPLSGAGLVLGNNLLARLLYSPKGAKLLTKGIQIKFGEKAAAAATFNELFSLANSGDVLEPVPAR